MVECNLAKVDVASSNLVSRSNFVNSLISLSAARDARRSVVQIELAPVAIPKELEGSNPCASVD